MSTEYLELAKKLISSADDEQIRNICIIAHVDHGKTTLSDFLLSSNKHVSSRQIQNGQQSGEAVRFLDSRMDEIDRQITIKSSCIALVYSGVLVNLIDSPGHVDFAAEVSAAARLTDGCILVVDCVEGVRAQTCSVIKQAWENRIIPILFLNKLDKLVDLFPEDFSAVHSRLRQIVENINALFSDLVEAFKEESGIDDPQLAELYQFDPVRGNVLFGSALHGWAFDLPGWTRKLVLPKLANQDMTRIFDSHFFSKFVTEQIWSLYAAEKQGKLPQLFPLSETVLCSVVTHVPSPMRALPIRSPILSCSLLDLKTTATVVYVVKHHPADLSIQCLLGDRVDAVRKLSGFVCISRIFFGELKLGQKLFSNESSQIVEKIFLLMGSSLVPVNSVVAGTVCAIQFAANGTLASGGVTLSSVPDFPDFITPFNSAQAIVRVTVSVKKSADEAALAAGLVLLARSDPAVVVSRHAQTGEQIVGCCGDEHLARCVQDLQQLFAPGLHILVSEPIVEIRETAAAVHSLLAAELPAWLSSEFKRQNNGGTPKNAWTTATSPDGTCEVSARSFLLSRECVAWMTKWQEALRSLFHQHTVPSRGWLAAGATVAEYMLSVEGVLADFGIADFTDMHVKNDSYCILTGGCEWGKFGFQQACMSGPLTEEPITGVGFELAEGSGSPSDGHSSSLSFATTLACRSALLHTGIRISEPLLSLELQTEHVGTAQAILSQRRANIFHSDLVEGSYKDYLLKATIPASDAFKIGDKSKQSFSDELRGATHGKIVWRLCFAQWVTLEDSDPLEPGSVAHKLVCQVRKRKGLSVGEKVIVTDADKQRTLTKMK